MNEGSVTNKFHDWYDYSTRRRAVSERFSFNRFDFVMADDFNDATMILEYARRNDFDSHGDMSQYEYEFVLAGARQP